MISRKNCKPGCVTARFPPSRSIASGSGTILERDCWIGPRQTIVLIRCDQLRQSKRSICSRLNVSCTGLRCPRSKGMFSPTLTLMSGRRECPCRCRRLRAWRGLATNSSVRRRDGGRADVRGSWPRSDLTNEARRALVVVRRSDRPHSRSWPTLRLQHGVGVTSAHPQVRSVNANGAANRAGIEVDDVIVAIDGEPIAFLSDLQDATNHPNRLITLSIVRHGQPLMVRATPRPGSDRALIGMDAADETPELTLSVAWRNFWLYTMVGLIVAAVVGLFCSLVSRGGIALRLIGAAVVTRNGAPASGARARLRAVLSWAPVLAASTALFAGHLPLLTLTPPASQFYAVRVLQFFPVFFPSEPTFVIARVAIITVAMAVFAIGVIAAVIEPERGLQDRLAGTWLVPR